MNIAATFRPIGVWPGERTKFPQRSRFDSLWNTTLTLLDYELGKLGAKNVVIQLALTERDIRLDGYPRANARPEHPGVVIAFESKFGPLKYATDTFDDWQDNVRAIALSLEALRKVDRYGITKRGEQYTGWKALPANTQPVMTTEAAAEFLSTACGGSCSPAAILESAVNITPAYRMAARLLHPDSGGAAGTTENFQKLQEAKRILDAHYGGGR